MIPYLLSIIDFLFKFNSVFENKTFITQIIFNLL